MQNRALAQTPPTPKGEYIVGKQENLPFVAEVLFFTSRKCTPL
jgi:hypothetical protein